MQTNIGNRLIANIELKSTPYEIRDNRLKGFLLRVQPSGTVSYICQYERGKRITLGKVGVLTPTQAREKAQAILAAYALGQDPVQSTKDKHADSTLGTFITQEYKPWVEAHRKSAKGTLERIKRCFSDFYPLPLASVTPLLIERWKSERRRKGISAATLNRDIVTLKAAISRAVEWGFLSVHPLSLVKPLKVDNNQKVRYLQPHEEERLLSALDEREDKIRQERRSANQWRLDRGLPQLPDLTYSPFVDYLKPMVQLTLNTGMRRGEVFHLHWKNIHFDMAFLTIEGENAKSGSTRHIPLNDEALSVLRAWREFSDSSNLVFPGKEGKPLDNIYTSWQNLLLSASITNFRWHDMRHHFASKLVMVGVDLNTVRELLGHADLKMTLRYAHLAPHIKAEAVAKLVYSRKG